MRINVYPSRLCDDDLAEVISLLFRSYDTAPDFCEWLILELQAEQVRRLKRGPVQRFALPLGWSGVVLGQALMVTNALTYGAPSVPAAGFADALHMAVTGAAAARLENAR